MASIGVFCSGEGTNLAALIDSGIAIDFVFADRACRAIERARQSGIRTVIGSERDVENERVPLIVLAGYMKILPPEFVRKFRIINLHPSLLPAFPGRSAVRAALDAGVAETGCTVHWVTEQVDGGPVIAQCAVPVLPEDDVETLTERIHRAEHVLLPEVVKSLI